MLNISTKNRVRFTLSHPIVGALVIAEPLGWAEDDKEYARNEKYHGIFTKFSNALQFVENGADFINKIRQDYGINAEITLKKEERHPKTDRWTLRYQGVLDLSTWESEDFKVKVKFNSSGLETELKARESDKIEIERSTDLDGNAVGEMPTDLLEFDGRKIFLLSSLKSENESTKSISEHQGAGGKTIDKLTPFPLNVDKKSHTTVQSTLYAPNFDRGEDDSPSTSICFVSLMDRKRYFKVNFDLSFIVTEINVNHPIENPKLQLRVVHYSGSSNYDIKNVDVIEDLNRDQLYNLNFQREYDLEQGDSLSLQFYTSARLGSTFDKGYWSFNYENCNGTITIEEDSFFEKSATKVVLAQDLGSRLIELLTGRKNAFKCDYLDGLNKGYTHGHWIRRFDKLPASEENKYKPFTTSWKDFAEDLMVTENLGLAIEKIGYKEQVVMRPKEDFYLNTVLIKLPYQVSKVKRKEISKNYYASLKIGYAKGWDNEEAMGLDEVNAQSNYITPIVRVSNELSLVSKYIYASYAAEFIRRKQITDFPTEDHRNDKQIFVFDMKPGTLGYQLKKWQDVLQKAPTGVYSPETAFNLTYSPLNLLLKHGKDIASFLTKNKNEYINFGGSEGNANLSTQQFAKLEYKENEKIKVSDLGRPRFVPEEISFNHEVSFDILEQVEGQSLVNGELVRNVYGLVQFINENGELEHGYLQSLKPNKEGTWKLIKANR